VYHNRSIATGEVLLCRFCFYLSAVDDGGSAACIFAHGFDNARRWMPQLVDALKMRL